MTHGNTAERPVIRCRPMTRSARSLVLFGLLGLVPMLGSAACDKDRNKTKAAKSDAGPDRVAEADADADPGSEDRPVEPAPAEDVPACGEIEDGAEVEGTVLAVRWIPFKSSEEGGSDCDIAHAELDVKWAREGGACRLTIGYVPTMDHKDLEAYVAGFVGKPLSGKYMVGQCWDELQGDL